MSNYEEHECRDCDARQYTTTACRKCHAGLLARYRGSQATIAEAVKDLQEMRDVLLQLTREWGLGKEGK